MNHSLEDKEQVIQHLLEVQEILIGELARLRAESKGGLAQSVAAGLAVIVTNAWKARAKMVDPTTGEPREEMRRIFRHVEIQHDAFRQMGLRIKDHTGDAFDYGLPLTVITTQPTRGLERERVLETIKPTIYWNEVIIQTGEVVVATPIPSKTS